MHASHKLSLIISDSERAEIVRYPVAAVCGWQFALDGVPLATVKEEAVLFHSEDHIMRYIAGQQPPWRPCVRCTDPMDCGSWASCCSPPRAGVEIDPKAADIRIEVDGKAVYIGFFSEDGRSVLMDLDAISRGEYGSFLGSPALQAWVDDRRKQAAAVAG